MHPVGAVFMYILCRRGAHAQEMCNANLAVIVVVDLSVTQSELFSQLTKLKVKSGIQAHY